MGIDRLTLPDHDVVAVSNINRQLLVLHSTICQSKAELVPANSDYVIVCIDSLSCKVALLAKSLKRELNVASSMDADNRLDPGRIKIPPSARPRCVRWRA